MQPTVKSYRMLPAALWTVQVLLSAGFLWAGFTKLFTPRQVLAEMWPWTATYPALVVVAGFADLLAGIGIILPLFFKKRKWLISAAAVGIIALMLASAGFHVIRGEASQTGINAVFAALAGFVLWARWRMV
ncbi:DoxX family protein [Dyadobacter sandarakinus]|uniref:DoxX family protein n=1 Tax=Dyadobacter sandarakinus TaxID=2747268 RepID=A0ABX7IAL1_9BACT|nr:DoxX family protein [Dyadobacter sandarakinus]QRR02487.1 DoxX family protein [Dyadobacter sandarakinus]